MDDNDIIMHLRKPFPTYELRYPNYTVCSVDEQRIEQDFFAMLLESFGPPRMTHEWFEQDIAEGWYLREHCLVLYDGSQPVAAGQVHLEQQGTSRIGFIDTLGVPKRYQGCGYGLEMTKRRIGLLDQLGVDEIRTEVEPDNAPMLSILGELGFVRSDPTAIPETRKD